MVLFFNLKLNIMSFLLKVKQLAYSVDIVNCSKQVELTNQYILPVIARLMSDVTGMRQMFDKHFLTQQKNKKQANPTLHGIKTIAEYPKGYCEDIRNGVFKLLEKHPFILAMREKGVLFQQVYVILNYQYFQNGLQLGNLWIDVANDTVNPTEPRIYYKNIQDLNYQNLYDYENYALVAEKYLHLKLFPNTIFPNIAPRFPFFAIDSQGICHLFNHQEIIFYKDILEQFKLHDQFLNSPFAKRVLPPAYEALIINHLHNMYKECPPLKNLLRQATTGNAFLKQHAEVLFENAIQEAMQFGFFFQMTQICPPLVEIKKLRDQAFIPNP